LSIRFLVPPTSSSSDLVIAKKSTSRTPPVSSRWCFKVVTEIESKAIEAFKIYPRIPPCRYRCSHLVFARIGSFRRLRSRRFKNANTDSWKAVVANDRNTKGEVTQMNRTSFSVGLTRTGRRCTKYESKRMRIYRRRIRIRICKLVATVTALQFRLTPKCGSVTN